MANFALALLSAAEQFRVNTPSFVDEGQSLISHTRRIPAHRIECTLKSTKLTDAERRAWLSFVARHGRHTAFDVVLPVWSTPVGSALGVPVLAVSASVGDTSLQLMGLTPYQSLFLADGDLLRLPGFSKVYLCAGNVTVDATGTAAVPIDPPLMRDAAVGAAVTVRSVPLTVFGSNDVIESEVTAKNGRYSVMELDVVEALI